MYWTDGQGQGQGRITQTLGDTPSNKFAPTLNTSILLVVQVSRKKK